MCTSCCSQDQSEPFTAIHQGFTARQANLILNRTGEPFWQAESYDDWVRDEPEYFRIAAYIENNPVKAGLVERAEDFSWSSANANERGGHSKKRLDTSVEAADTSVCATNLIPKVT